MAKVIFKQQPGKAPELFPVNIFDKIPSDHPVRLVDAVVDGLDIEEIIKRYKGGGTSAYHPRMMIKVLFYSYLSNIYSCRKIAKALEENIHFMFISGNSTPDFRTINDFRGKVLKDKIKDIFAQVVNMLIELGYVSLEVQYIDGTKIEAKSNRYTFVWRKSVEKHKEKLEAKISAILAAIESSIEADNQVLNEEKLPQKVDVATLREKLAELNKHLKEPKSLPAQNPARDLKKLQDEHLPKLEEYEHKLALLGERNSYSKTDPDATFMRLKDDHMKNGQLKPAYNVQISTENQFITHATIHQTPADTTTLPSHLASFEAAYARQSTEVVADAGYGSEENYELLEKQQIEAYVKYNYFHKEQKKAFKNNPFLVPNLFYNAEQDFYVCPMGQRMAKTGTYKRTTDNGFVSEVSHYQAKRCDGCPLRGQCHRAAGNRIIEVNHRLNGLKDKARALLSSEKGLSQRRKRPVEVEAVFGQLKSNNHFNRFTFTGIEKVELECLLMALGHNLRKMVAKVRKATKTTRKATKKAANTALAPLFRSYASGLQDILSYRINTIYVRITSLFKFYVQYQLT